MRPRATGGSSFRQRLEHDLALEYSLLAFQQRVDLRAEALAPCSSPPDFTQDRGASANTMASQHGFLFVKLIARRDVRLDRRQDSCVPRIPAQAPAR